ncbi:hypothetical protein niasHS_010459 [Heterodera schachtii]|uniref:Uncharacterized protein n=1 Tax=Heterodera schachtii TaxID=97005 RepID=A0ABD2J4R0_HETSC
MASLPQTTRTGQNEDDFWDRLHHQHNRPVSLLRMSARRASAPFRIMPRVHLLSDQFDQQQGVRVPVSKARFRTMDALLDQLNESIPLPFGVRRLHTPYGKTQVSSLEDLKPHGKYVVASGTRQVRGVDLEAMERRKRRREEAQRRWNFQPQQSPAGASQSSIQLLQIDQQHQQNGENEATTSAAYHSDPKESNNHYRTTTTTQTMDTVHTSGTKQAQQKLGSFMPVTFKQVFFVLNGHPHRVYRALINPTRRGQLDQLLEEVSHGLQAAIFRLYSFDGDRVLSIDQLLQLKDMRAVAVPRHEQLTLNGISPHSNIVRPGRAPPVVGELNSSANAFTSLPPIHRIPKKVTSRSSKSSSGASSSTNVKESVEFDSRVNKRKKLLNDLPTFAAEENGRQRMQKADNNQIGEAAVGKGNSSIGSRLEHGQMVAKTANSIVSADSDSGRPRTELESEPIVGQDEEEENHLLVEDEEKEEEEEEEEDYPEEPEELRALRREAEEEEEEHVKDGEREREEEEERAEKGRESSQKKEEEKDGEEERKRGKGEEEQNGEATEEEKGDQNELEGRTELDEAAANQDVTNMEIDQKIDANKEALVEHEQHGHENQEDQEAGDEHIQDDQEKKTERVADEHGKLGHEKPAHQQQQQQEKPFMLGVYSDELEQILYGEAAVKIQSAWRGYSTRKELKNGQLGVPPQVMVNGAKTVQRHSSKRHKKKKDMYKANERHLAALNNVARPRTPRHDATLDSSSEREEATHGTDLMMERNKERLSWETPEALDHPAAAGDKQALKNLHNEFLYTVTVITGNRWAADTEANLYIDMHGTDSDSGRLWLKQEFTNWLHSGPAGPRFRQNQSDSFTFRLPSRLGIINRLTVGHERHGYGAGVFIDRILVTEDEVDEADEVTAAEAPEGQMPPFVEHCADCRQFLFLCNRWFDSGQVDGKLERNVRLSAFYMISSIPVDGRVTRGRWEFVLHGGTTDGRGGTSSQLAITGYGTAGQSTTSGLYDSRMANAPSDALMQLDFGNIGELLKVRVELDGGDGTSPDYFLNFVEFKDLDTDENFVVMCGKWLRWRSAKKGDQPFRELIAFHIGVEPLPLIIYEGKIRAIHSPVNCLIAEELRLELHGDLGDTGHVLVPMSADKNGVKPGDDGTDAENADAVQWTDIPFRMEAVSVGRVGGARVHFVPNFTGEQIFEGLLTLQNIFKKQNVWPPAAANSSFVFSQIRLTESPHTPYRYVLNRSQLHERRCDQPENYSLVKELLTTEMEGISTRLRNRKNQSKKMPRKWLLQMALSEGSTILPEVFLCWEKEALAMTPLDSPLSDGILSYQHENVDNFELFTKVRILSDGQTFLEAPNSVQIGQQNEAAANKMPFTYVDKVRICDTANGDELRFPSADCMLQRHSVYELPAVWPDRSPMPILIYSVRIATGPSTDPTNPELIVQLNLFGEYGDVGQRKLIRDDQQEHQQQTVASDQQQHEMPPPLFAPKTSCAFEFEAVSIGDIHCAEVMVDTKDTDFCWECTEMVITDFRGRYAPFYAFKFASPFTVKCRAQIADVLPFTDAL